MQDQIQLRIVTDDETVLSEDVIACFDKGDDQLEEIGLSPEQRPTGVGLDEWLAEAGCCGVRAVETFAAGLHQDGAAVRVALTLPWSNGQAEGQITRLRMIKRRMYGRANLDLLRRRILLAA
jgi:transposase